MDGNNQGHPLVTVRQINLSEIFRRMADILDNPEKVEKIKTHIHNGKPMMEVVGEIAQQVHGLNRIIC